MSTIDNTKQGPYYGWWNVGVSFVGLSLSYAMFTIFAFGVFLKPLAEEYGWPRDAMALAYTVTNLTIVAVSPLLGVLIDRFGVRRILIPSVALMGLAVAAMSQLTGNIYHFYAMYLLIPLLGAGTLPTSYSRVIIAWFFSRRGIALGISLAGFGVGAALIPPLGQWLIDHYGWRAAYLVFAALILLVSLPLTMFLLREKPAQGQAGPIGSDKGAPRLRDDAGLTLGQAAHTRNFWLIFFSFLLVGFGISSVLAHLVPMLTDRGVDPTVAAYCQMALGLGLIFGRVLAGYLMDHFFAPYVAAVFLVGLFLGLVILALGTSNYLVFVAAVLVGLATGSEIGEIAYIVSRYFGPKAYGMIYGIMFAAFQLGSAGGPPALGRYFVTVGDYRGALWVMAGLVLVGTVLITLLSPYPKLELAEEKR